MEEKKILKELITELIHIERDLRFGFKIMKNHVPDETKLDIIKNLQQIENSYHKNISDLEKLEIKHINKDLNKMNKVLNKIHIMRLKLESSLNKEVI